MIEFIQPNTTLQNRYLIENYIAKGAMGAVYRAFDSRLKCNVAIKQQLLDLDDFTIKMFRREAELLANLKHSGLPKVTDFFFDDDNYFLVMELVEGEDLQSILKKGERLDYEQGLYFFEQLLDILNYLYSNRIIHSDIKPANLKIDEDLNLKLIDFGLAKGSFGKITSDVDAIGGTPLYMSLEQTEYGQGNDLEISEKSDLYSACATFYHLLTGQPPISAFKRLIELVKNDNEQLRLACEINSEIPKSVAELIHQGMELLPQDRIETAFELKQLLQQKKIDKYRKYTKWSSQGKFHQLAKSSFIPERDGITPLISTNANGDSEVVLAMIDRTPFVYELAAVKPFTLKLKSILYQTSHGFLVCSFFYVPNPTNPKRMFAGFETYINLFNPHIVTTNLQLARQTHWHLFLIDSDNEVVDLFEFQNCFDLEDTINRAIKITRNSSHGNFMMAKEEFMNTFSMDDLFQM